MDKDICYRLKNIEISVEKILKLLNGNDNGDGGLITRVALNAQTVDNLPSPKNLRWCAGIGSGAVTSFGLTIWLIYYLIKSAFTGN